MIELVGAPPQFAEPLCEHYYGAALARLKAACRRGDARGCAVAIRMLNEGSTKAARVPPATWTPPTSQTPAMYR
jgi:hypothetical protein